MRKIYFGFLFTFAVFTASFARAQDSATQDQIDQINGRIQDMDRAQALQDKRIAALEKEIGDLQDKLNQPARRASPDDLKNLAAQVQEIDKKRQEDNDRILKELERLEKSLNVAPPSHQTEPSVSTRLQRPGQQAARKRVMITRFKRRTRLSAIARAYRAKGIKVTTDQILAANPGLNPKNLIVGKKIFIPDPNAK